MCFAICISSQCQTWGDLAGLSRNRLYALIVVLFWYQASEQLDGGHGQTMGQSSAWSWSDDGAIKCMCTRTAVVKLRSVARPGASVTARSCSNQGCTEGLV